MGQCFTEQLFLLPNNDVNCRRDTLPEQQYKFIPLLSPRVNNRRGECLTPYSPVIDDCAEVKRLLFHVTYRLASIFSHLTTKAIPDTRACVQFDVQVHHEEHHSVAYRSEAVNLEDNSGGERLRNQ